VLLLAAAVALNSVSVLHCQFQVSREENLSMVSDSVYHLKAAGKEVMLDLEHFFDGYKANPV
jgi:2-isopropylmalate synthase